MPDHRYRGMGDVAAVVLPALVLVALAWSAAILLMGHELDMVVANAYRQNANLALAFEQHTLSTIRSVDQTLRLVARTLKAPGGADLAAIERARHTDGDVVTSVLIADSAGKVIAGADALEALSLANREFFARHRDRDTGNVLVSKPVQGTLSGRIIIPVSRRMEHADGTFAGVAAAGVDPVSFVSYYRQMEMGHSGMVQLVGTDGATRVRRTGTYISSRPAVGSSTLLKLQAGSDSGNFLSQGNQEGVPRYTSFRTLREFDLVVAVGTAADDVLEAYATRRNALLGAAAVFTAAVALVAGLMLISMRGRRRSLLETMRSEAQFRATFHQAAIGVAHVALDGRFLKVNETLCRLLRYPEEALLQRRFVDLKPPEERAAAEKGLLELLERGTMPPVEGSYLRQDGTLLWASVAPALVRGPDGRPEYFVAMVQDVGERIAAQEKVLRRSHFDPLTDLPNRALFADRLAQVLRHARHRH